MLVKQETPINIVSEAQSSKVTDLNANPGSKFAAPVPLQSKSSILHDKLYEVRRLSGGQLTGGVYFILNRVYKSALH